MIPYKDSEIILNRSQFEYFNYFVYMLLLNKYNTYSLINISINILSRNKLKLLKFI